MLVTSLMVWRTRKTDVNDGLFELSNILSLTSIHCSFVLGLYICMLDLLDHVFDSCGLCLNNAVSLAMTISHKVKYCRSNEIYDSKVGIS